MNVDRGQMDTIPILTSLSQELELRLPPCRVCGKPGEGFHFGVNTCGACKSFFDSSLHCWREYKCEGNNDCRLQPSNVPICKRCRFQKCLDVGMSKQGISDGYAHVKTDDYILQLLARRISTSEMNTPQHCSIIPKYNDRDEQTKNEEENSRFSPVRGYHSMDAVMAKESYVPKSPNTCSNDENVQAGLTYLLSSSSEAGTLADFFAEKPKLFTGLDNSADSQKTPAEIGAASDDIGLASYDVAAQPAPTDLDEFSDDTFDLQMHHIFEINQLYADYSASFKALSDAYERTFGSFDRQLTPEMFAKAIQDHNDSCPYVQSLMSLQSQPAHQSSSQGINRLRYQNNSSRFDLGDNFKYFLRQLIGFAQSIPGFLFGDVKENIDIIIECRYEFFSMFVYKFSNPEQGLLCDWNKQLICYEELKHLGMTAVQGLFKAFLISSKQLKTLKLTSEERIILMALIVVRPGRSTRKNSSEMSLLYKNLSKLFIYHGSRNPESAHMLLMKTLGILDSFTNEVLPKAFLSEGPNLEDQCFIHAFLINILGCISP